MNYTKMTVGIDEFFPPLPALVSEMRWNGWVVPYFTLDTVRVIADTLALTDLGEGEKVTIDDDGVWLMNSQWAGEYDDPRGEPVYPTVIDGVTYYCVAGMDWCWHEVDENEEDE
jgi:hypothetical protein